MVSPDIQSDDKLNDQDITPAGHLKKEYSISSIAAKPAVELSVEEKVQIIFELPERDTYVGEYACWLMRTVPLKGYMYVTQNHICFYSSLPSIPVRLANPRVNYANLDTCKSTLTAPFVILSIPNGLF